MRLLVASYYTNDRYKAHALDMVKSAEFVGLSPELHEEADRGGHVLNTHRKPYIIRDMLSKAKEDAILFVDADCRFRQHPTLCFRTDHDFGCYYHEKDYAWSGVIFAKKNARGMAVLDAWIGEVESFPKRHTRRALHPALEKAGVKAWRMDPAYAWVERWFRHRFPTAVPVIEDLVTDEFVPEQRDDYPWQ